ncbi:MAG: zf-TFIIB domain-containing protein [Aggregatilineales bacterium]
MQCPVCDVELKIADRQGVEIDYCPKCRGVWLDRGELDKLIERSAQIEHQSAPPPPRREKRDDFYTDVDDDSYEISSGDRYRDNDRSYPQGKKKKSSFLGDVFDLFG